MLLCPTMSISILKFDECTHRHCLMSVNLGLSGCKLWMDGLANTEDALADSNRPWSQFALKIRQFVADLNSVRYRITIRKSEQVVEI